MKNSWIRLKIAWFFLLIGLCNVDLLIQRFIQNWIADPLQFSGISLSAQVRGCQAMVVSAWLLFLYYDALHRIWFAMSIHLLAMAGSFSYLLYVPAQIALTLERSNRFTFTGLVWLWFSLTIALTCLFSMEIRLPEAALELLALGFALKHYISGCEPKPPARHLKPSLAGS